MSPKYDLDAIKIMLKLVHSKITKEQIKLVIELSEYGIDKNNVDKLYDTLADDMQPLTFEQTPSSSQPRSESALANFESPPSSQGYPAAICSDNETNHRTNEIDSPPYVDEDPWVGLPRDPNYTPRPCIQSDSNKKISKSGDQADNTTSPSTSTSTSTTIATVATTPNTSEKRTRDRFVFRTIHQDILNNAFFQNAYPENDEKEILVDACNHALETYKNRPLRENEKMTILNITNWFNNRRKEKKRKFHQDPSLQVAIQPNKYPREEVSRVKEEVISEQEDDF